MGMGMIQQAPGEGADPAREVAPPLGVYGVTYVAGRLGISRGYVSFLARHRIAPFLPTHECQGEAGTRSQALFTPERVATIIRCFRNAAGSDPAALAGEVVLLYGVTYLAQVLGYSRNRISPLVQERVAPFWPTHALLREDGGAGPALFTIERIQHIVGVRREQALGRRYAVPGVAQAGGVLLAVAARP